MLNAMRKNLKKLSWTLWLVIITFIGTIFAVWGIGGNTGSDRPDVAAWIDDKPVSAQEFYDAQRRIRNYYQQVFGEKFAEMESRLQIGDMALQQLIQVQALIGAAKELGLSASSEDIGHMIKSMPEFQEQGVFSRTRFERLLKYSHISENDFLEQVRADMLRQQIQRFIQESVWVSDAEVKDNYRLEHERSRLAYLQVDAKAISATLTPSTEELTTWFEERKADYQLPAKIAVSYMSFDPERYKTNERFVNAQGYVSEEDIEDFYYENEDDYRTEKEVRASHILIKSDGTDPALDQIASTKAQEILDKIREGSDFAEMAIQYSEDASGPQGGDVGFFPRSGRMVEPFAAAAFDLKKGRTSEVVKTRFGYHIIKVTEIKEATLAPLESVANDIKQKILLGRAVKYAETEAERMRGSFKSDLGFEALAKRAELEAMTTEPFAEREIIPSLGWMPEFSQAAFALKDGEISSVIKERDKFFLIALKERFPSRQAEFDEVRDKVRDAYIERTSLQQAGELMEKLVPQIEAGTDWATIADGETIKIGDTGLFGRKESIQGIGQDENLVNMTFAKNANDTFGPLETGGAFYYFRVIEHQQPDWNAFEQEKESLRTKLLAGKRNRYFNFWTEQLTAKARVVKNPAFFDRTEDRTEG